MHPTLGRRAHAALTAVAAVGDLSGATTRREHARLGLPPALASAWAGLVGRFLLAWALTVAGLLAATLVLAGRGAPGAVTIAPALAVPAAHVAAQVLLRHARLGPWAGHG